MSWFQSLRDDFTLRPFEIQQTHSDGAAMASGTPDVMTNQEPAEVQEECSGKKKSKFQTFKKFFARKKRKDPSAAGADTGLKASQSSDNVSKASETLTRAEKDKGSGSKISLGGKALSHDSVFVSDSSEANEALGASQDSIHGKVKSLQLQLKQAIKLGSPPSLMCVKRTEDAGTMSEDDGLPCSPPEYTTLHTALAQGNSSISLEGIDSDEDQLSCAASSRAVSPLVVPGDFSQPASPFVCLNNSAAKHKLALRQKAKRRPASRPEGKAGSDSVVEELLTTSIPEAETAQQQDLQKAEDATDDLLKPKVESEEEEEEEESEEEEQPQHSEESLLGEKEEWEEGEDESEAEQDVSQGPDTSCPPEPSHSEEEDSDTQPLPSSKLSSSTSSLDSPRATPEPPAGLTDISIASGAEENKDVSHSASEGEEDGVQEHREEENSFLQEVLSSLKEPLMSSSLDVKTEGVVLEMKEDEAEEKEKEEAEMEEGEEMEEEEDESLSSQAAPSCSMLSDQTTMEEEQVNTSFWQEEEGGEVAAKEEIKGGGEEETEDDEEDPVVERFIRSDDEEEADEQAVEVKTEEESNVLSSQTISQAGDSVEEEDEESDGEEEAIELEKKPDVEEVGWEKREEDEEVEVEATERTGVEEAEEAMEGEDDGAEEMPEMLPDTQGEEVQAPVHEADEGVVLEDDSVHTVKHTNDDQIPTEMADQVLTTEQEHFNQNSGDKTEEGEEIIEEGVDLNIVEQKSDQEENVEASQSDADQSEQELEQESVEVTPHSDTKQVEKDPSQATEQDDISSKPPPLSLPPHEPQSQESEASTPSKTSTTTIHINLVSPSSEKATSLFQLPPAAADLSQSATEAPSYDIESTSVDKEEADAVGEEKQSNLGQEATPPASIEEKVNQPPCSTDQSKVRFTIAPAWQRSQSLNPPPSPPASVSSSSAVAPPCGEELEAATEDSVMKAEPATSPKVELVLSPIRVRNAGSSTAKPQSGVTPAPVTPKISTSASTEESSVIAEGNPENPFGVRLRKTSALLRFSSEEENTEPPVESQTQPTSSKDDSPQPVSVKPSICPPVSNKPALPKKPEVHGDSGGKLKRVSDPAAGRGVSAGSVPPSWISVAKQKQKIYKENSLEEITVKKEEQERKSSLPAYVSSAASKEQGTKTAESKVSHLEMTKPSVSPDKEARRPFSPPTPVPPQPLKSHPLPCPISPKPYVPPPQAKYPPQPHPLQRSLSTSDTPKSPVTPPSPSKTPLPVTCSPFSRTTSEKPSLRAPGVSGQTASSQRNLPPPALAQDEPPWMALAKKKAKAWSEMPQIVQ
ncbi:cancer-related regulator of actin dynamics isoform X2 [Archocentrus centrarchus]|uniref:cancer-related regulator of actin dynamics isoform X2 n=1 Tax=Archocentrus centrarchus TaxID=63155 RepID=UPI0011E9F0A4|nr:cancer-related regulator of actin dynamics-like isoform X2 [Archocentrus centrarchus]